MTPTPETNCPYCGAEATGENGVSFFFKCGSVRIKEEHRKTLGFLAQDSPTPICREREARQKAEAEVERLRGLLREARPILGHTSTYCFDAVNCICGTEYLGERIDEALNPDSK